MSSTSRALVVCALLLWLHLSDARVTPWGDGAAGRQSDIVTSRPHQFPTLEEEGELQGGLLPVVQLQAQLVMSDESLRAPNTPAPGPESPPSPPPSSESDPVPPPPQPLSPPEALPPPPSGSSPAEDEGEATPPEPLSPPEALPPPPSGSSPAEDEDEATPPEPLSPPEVLPPPSVPLPQATLASLRVDGGKLVPAFAEDRWDYVLLVPCGATAVRFTIFLAKGDEDFVVKLEGIPLANGIEGPPIAINDQAGSGVQSLRITVTAIAHYPTTYILDVQRDDTTSTSELLLWVFLWFLSFAAIALLIYGFYAYVVTGRERGWWPFRYYLRETPPPGPPADHANEPLLE